MVMVALTVGLRFRNIQYQADILQTTSSSSS